MVSGSSSLVLFFFFSFFDSSRVGVESKIGCGAGVCFGCGVGGVGIVTFGMGLISTFASCGNFGSVHCSIGWGVGFACSARLSATICGILEKHE